MGILQQATAARMATKYVMVCLFCLLAVALSFKAAPLPPSPRDAYIRDFLADVEEANINPDPPAESLSNHRAAGGAGPSMPVMPTMAQEKKEQNCDKICFLKDVMTDAKGEFNEKQSAARTSKARQHRITADQCGIAS